MRSTQQSCSMSFSPGKSGDPFNSSPSMQPTALQIQKPNSSQTHTTGTGLPTPAPSSHTMDTGLLIPAPSLPTADTRLLTPAPTSQRMRKVA